MKEFEEYLCESTSGKSLADKIAKFSSVKSVNPYKDRFYVNLKGENFALRGDKNLKIFVDGSTVKLDQGAGGRLSPEIQLAEFIKEMNSIATVTKKYSDSQNTTWEAK